MSKAWAGWAEPLGETWPLYITLRSRLIVMVSCFNNSSYILFQSRGAHCKPLTGQVQRRSAASHRLLGVCLNVPASPAKAIVILRFRSDDVSPCSLAPRLHTDQINQPPQYQNTQLAKPNRARGSCAKKKQRNCACEINAPRIPSSGSEERIAGMILPKAPPLGRKKKTISRPFS